MDQRTGRWTKLEKQQFERCVKRYGQLYEKYALNIPTRSHVQIRSHAQKFFDRVSKRVMDDVSWNHEPKKSLHELPPVAHGSSGELHQLE